MTSISRRLIFWLAVPLLLLALCGALVRYYNNITPGLISSDRRLREAANSIMAHLEVRDEHIVLVPDAADRSSLPLSDFVKYAVRDTGGSLMAGDAQIPVVPLGDDTSQLFAMSQIDHRSLRTLTTRFDTRAGVTLITVADVRAVGAAAAKYGLISTLLWDFAELNVTLVLVWVGIYLGLRPIKRLRDEIAARSPLDLRPILDSSAPREIAPVVVTLNRLFALLRSTAQSQQQFIANTAHQLRTPIAGIKAQLELLLAESAASPVKDRLLTLQEGVRQLAHSANQLLTLARADPSVNLATKNKKIALDKIAQDVAARFIDRALQLQIDLGVEISAASTTADPALIDDLMSNLIDNALKYTPPGGTVTLCVGEQAGKSYLSVEDTGPGIPAAYREQVRQRFFRLPNTPGHGSGLGLAIVDEIAKLYGARVAIGAGVGGRGARIEVRFS
jgi:two-component system, OmpR family, sensor histidine kinase TctE